MKKASLNPLTKLFAVLTVCSALSMHAEKIHYVVTGDLDNADNKTMYLFDYDRKANIDSATVADGKFRFEGTYNRNAFVRVECDRATFSNCVLDTMAVVDFETHFPSGGSMRNMALKDYHDAEEVLQAKLREKHSELQKKGLEHKKMWGEWMPIFNSHRHEFIELFSDAIVNHPDGVGEAFLMSFGSFNGLTPQEWNDLYVRMPQNLKDTRIGREFNQKYNQIIRTGEGNPFIDFEAKTTDGKTVKFSDYVGKGKYVLVDFWATWCGPCRKIASEVLQPLYEKHAGDERFMILGVAVWDDPEDTSAYLTEHPYPWTNLIDAGETPMRQYGFDYVPYFILFGPDGTILLRHDSTPDMFDRLDSVLNR